MNFRKSFPFYTRVTYYEHYLFICFWLLFTTGLRIGEAAALQWDDIDFESGIISVTKTLYYKSMTEIQICGTQNICQCPNSCA